MWTKRQDEKAGGKKTCEKAILGMQGRKLRWREVTRLVILRKVGEQAGEWMNGWMGRQMNRICG